MPRSDIEEGLRERKKWKKDRLGKVAKIFTSRAVCNYWSNLILDSRILVNGIYFKPDFPRY